MQSLTNIWAKFSKEDPSSIHPLIFHIFDTFAVSHLMWEKCLSESFKAYVSEQFGLSSKEMGVTISFWVSLHDIGKAGPEFQKKNPLQKRILEEKGFTFPPPLTTDGFHATATTLILQRLFDNYPRKFRNHLAYALGGHHGEFPTDRDITNLVITQTHVGDKTWQETQQNIYYLTRETFLPNEPCVFPKESEELNALLLLITGLSTTADWIASNQEFFPFCKIQLDLSGYLKKSNERALSALKTLGWLGWKADEDVLSFTDMFQGFIPNSTQKSVIELTENLQSPFLMIIEAPTGSGKTEAALYTADTTIQKDKKAGIYIAMPTQATSNQMYHRMRSYLSRRYSDTDINLHLVHGAAQLQKNFQYRPENIWANEEQSEANINSHSWFLPRKRTLLAPFGVGTVDQTFLSVLRTRHFFLRLFGLSHKVLVFDEVHAYDIYMMEIFETLLQWLNAVGTSVIILTATLPTETRKRLLKSFNGLDVDSRKVPFPRISIAERSQTSIQSGGEIESRCVKIVHIRQDPECIVKELKRYLENGGCAAVICNRVNRAQDIFLQVKQAFDEEQIELILFHSRFPQKWRMEIEQQVLNYFGKDRSNRPKKAILIATQVIEQSLDLDFDLLISDLAPIDLIIQRIGRLHRHTSQATKRPSALRAPICFISSPPFDNKIPSYGGDSFIYDPYFLAKTHFTLKGRSDIILPGESDGLIESVYTLNDDINLDENERKDLVKLKNSMLDKHALSREKSHMFLIPESSKNFIGSLQSFFGDDVNSITTRIINAPTREIEASVDVVCLNQEADGLHLPDEVETIDLEKTLKGEDIVKCLTASLSINNRKVLSYLLNAGIRIPTAFKACAALRWHFPLIFTNSIFETQEFTLELRRDIGLKIWIK